MKLVHIFWSLLILTILIFIPGIFYRTNSKLGGGADLFAFFLLIWTVTSVVSPVILVLRKLKIIKSKILFPLTLLAIFNLYFGSYGIYMILSDQVYRPGFALKFLGLNLVWAVLLILLASSKASRTPS